MSATSDFYSATPFPCSPLTLVASNSFEAHRLVLAILSDLDSAINRLLDSSIDDHPIWEDFVDTFHRHTSRLENLTHDMTQRMHDIVNDSPY